MKDADLLDMSLRKVSNLLEDRFNENLKKGMPVASAVLFGTSPTTGKRMRLAVMLTEDTEDELDD